MDHGLHVCKYRTQMHVHVVYVCIGHIIFWEEKKCPTYHTSALKMREWSFLE